MARYRKVDVRIWGDEKFRSLSAPGPNGQTLWFALLFGEQTGIIPGLAKVGELAFAEQLNWTLNGFRDAFQDVSRQGMAKADWKARLVWVPKAIRYNTPTSPNIVKHWAEAWNELPECELKAEAHRELESFLNGIGDAFGNAFREACPKPSGMPYGIQEQDQEQDQEQNPPLPPKAPVAHPAPPARPAPRFGGDGLVGDAFRTVKAHWLTAFERSRGAEYVWDGRAASKLNEILESGLPPDELCNRIELFFADEWSAGRATLGLFLTKLPSLVAPPGQEAAAARRTAEEAEHRTAAARRQAAIDAEVMARWRPLLEVLTADQRDALDAEKREVGESIYDQGLRHTDERRALAEAENKLFAKWSALVRSRGAAAHSNGSTAAEGVR